MLRADLIVEVGGQELAIVLPGRVTTSAHDVLGETDERLPFELAGNEQGEAVPGPADEHGVIGNLLAQVLGDEPDDVVAGATIKRVVGVTESVDVDQQNGDARAGLTFGMFVDPTVEITLIRKVRQRIVHLGVLELLFGRVLVGDVSDIDDQAVDIRITQHIGHAGLEVSP